MDTEACSAIVLGLASEAVQPCFVAPGASGETLKVHQKNTLVHLEIAQELVLKNNY